MTVCVGVPYTNGIVLAADTQITATTYKDYGPKLGFTGNETHAVGMAGSGYSDLLNDTMDRLVTSLASIRVRSFVETKAAIEQELTTAYKRRMRDARNQSMLCAISVPSEPPRLLHFQRLIPSEEGITIIGCGDVELTRFLKSLIHERPRTMDEALHWAIYLVWRAKKFVNGCGGDTGALVIKKDAKIDQVSYSRTRFLETYLGEVEQQTAEFHSRIMFSPVNETEFHLWLEGFQQRMWETHTRRFKDFT